VWSCVSACILGYNVLHTEHATRATPTTHRRQPIISSNFIFSLRRICGRKPVSRTPSSLTLPVSRRRRRARRHVGLPAYAVLGAQLLQSVAQEQSPPLHGHFLAAQAQAQSAAQAQAQEFPAKRMRIHKGVQNPGVQSTRREQKKENKRRSGAVRETLAGGHTCGTHHRCRGTWPSYCVREVEMVEGEVRVRAEVRARCRRVRKRAGFLSAAPAARAAACF